MVCQKVCKQGIKVKVNNIQIPIPTFFHTHSGTSLNGHFPIAATSHCKKV